MTPGAAPDPADRPEGRDRVDRIAAEFAAVFGVPEVAEDADFFELGGDSLLAETLATRLGALFGGEVRVSVLFDRPTPRALAEHFAGPAAAPATDAAGRPPIFMVHGGSGFTMPKKPFFDGLAPDQRLELLQLPGLTGAGPMPTTIEEMAAAYSEQILCERPSGRIHLSAFCNGALVAVEIVRKLAEAGRRVDHVVLLDPGVPSMLDRIHKGRKARLKDRLIYFPITGRLTGGASLEDVRDPRLLRWRGRFYTARFFLKWLGANLGRNRGGRHAIAARIRSRGRIAAANRHYWPPRIETPVDVVCSRERARIHEDPDGFWRRFLPDMTVWCVLDRHEDVIGVSSMDVSRKMQELFDRADGRQAAA